MRIIELDEVGSTNEYCKSNDDGTDVLVIAAKQTNGRGTKGRSFVSAEGGLYFSCMWHYEDFPSDRAFTIMVRHTVAVCKTLEKFGVKPTVRWANDVLVCGKKISGTLIENTLSNGRITRSIVGTGININNALPAELLNTATSLKEQTGRATPLKKVIAVMVENLQRDYGLEDYKAYIDYFGKEVTLLSGDRLKKVTALDVACDGRLVVREEDGSINYISAAEVGLRI